MKLRGTDRRPPARASIPDKIGIIGNTQGVSDNRSPNPRKASTVETRLPPSVMAPVSSPLDDEGVQVETSLPPRAGAGAAALSAGASSISNVARSMVFATGG